MEGKKNTGMAIVAYILFFVPLLTDAKNDPFVMYHVRQSIGLIIASIGLSIIAGMLTAVVIGVFLVPLVQLFILVEFIIGIINASKGEMKPLPLIGKFAEKKA